MKRYRTAAFLVTLLGGCASIDGLDNEFVLSDDGCEPGEARACYSGPSATEGVGECEHGTQICNAEGTEYGPCEGEVLPQKESCVTQADEDCDGQSPVDEDDGCMCIPGTGSICYSGLPGTAETAACTEGVHFCNDLGTEYGPCAGEVVPAAEVCGSPEDESCDGAPGCSGAPIWSKVLGDAAYQFSKRITVDHAGNIVLTGDFEGSVDFGGGPLSAMNIDIFVVKLDAAGAHVWSKQFQNLFGAYVAGLATDTEGNIVITGLFEDTIDLGGGPLESAGLNIFVVKLDPSGNHIWSKVLEIGQLNIGSFEISDVKTDSAGNVVLTGSFGEYLKFGDVSLASAGEGDIFVVKLDASGNHVWSKSFGDGATQRAYGVAVDGAGNIVLLGDFLGQVDFGGGPLSSPGDEDGFVVKLDASGKHIWSKQFVGNGNSSGSDAAADSAGNIILTGVLNGTIDFGDGGMLTAPSQNSFVAKLDSSGKHLWSKASGGSYSKFNSIAIDGAGYIVLTGHFSDTVDLGGGTLKSVDQFYDSFVAKLDGSGTHVWSKSIGGVDFQYANGGAPDSGGSIVLTGSFTGTIDLGNGPVTSAGDSDLFIARIAP